MWVRPAVPTWGNIIAEGPIMSSGIGEPVSRACDHDLCAGLNLVGDRAMRSIREWIWDDGDEPGSATSTY